MRPLPPFRGSGCQGKASAADVPSGRFSSTRFGSGQRRSVTCSSLSDLPIQRQTREQHSVFSIQENIESQSLVDAEHSRSWFGARFRDCATSTAPLRANSFQV